MMFLQLHILYNFPNKQKPKQNKHCMLSHRTHTQFFPTNRDHTHLASGYILPDTWPQSNKF